MRTTRARLPLGLDFLHNCIFRFSAIVRFRSPFLGIFAIAPFFAFLRLVSFRNDGTFRERKSRMGSILRGLQNRIFLRSSAMIRKPTRETDDGGDFFRRTKSAV